MRLLDEDEIIKTVDNHTNDDETLDDDISCILEEVPTAFDMQTVMNQIKKCNCDDIDSSICDIYNDCFECAKDKCIEIIRKCGV